MSSHGKDISLEDEEDDDYQKKNATLYNIYKMHLKIFI